MAKISGIKTEDVTGDWRIVHNSGFMICIITGDWRIVHNRGFMICIPHQILFE